MSGMKKNKEDDKWLQRFLRRFGRKYPFFFVLMLDDLGIIGRGKNIMMRRYIYGDCYKQINENCELRQVMRCHKKAIDVIKNM